MNNFLSYFSDRDVAYSLYGLVLGDGTYSSGAIRNSHTNKQRFYCIWLKNIFADYGLKTKLRLDFIKKTTFGEYLYSETSIYVPNRFYFEVENKIFDDNGKKIVSEYVMNNINPFGLLLWYLDDGNLSVSFKDGRGGRFAYLNTQSFSLSENVFIQNIFKNRFNINLRIHKDSSGFEKYKDKIYYRLYFNASAFRQFFDIIREYLPYIPKEFYYKFNMQYYPTRILNSVGFSEKYNLI